MKPRLHHYWYLLTALLLPALLAFSPAPTNQGIPTRQPGGADVYLVDITLLNISDINISAGTFQADMYISFRCQNPPCQHEPQWDVMNSVQDLSPISLGTSVPFQSYDYRIKTSLIGSVDYTYYPFTYICFHIFIEDKALSNTQITYQLHSLQPDQTLFNPTGWHYRPAQNGWKNIPVSYAGKPVQYDRLDAWVFMEQDRLGSFMKTIFAALVILLVGMLSFLLRVDDAKERLALTSSTLVALVLYHISLVASVPSTGYLMFIDKFMIAAYVVVFLSMAVSVALMVHINKEQKEQAQRLHLRTRWTIPTFWFFLMGYVFIFQLFIPYAHLLATSSGM